MTGQFRRPGEAGVALVVTLMMMSVLTMMVVGLAGVMRNEQAAARNLTYQVLAEQMAEIGAQEAMARVLSNSPVGTIPSATGPGWSLNNGTFIPLFSSDPANQTVDLEKVGTNSMILSVFSGQSGSVRAGWTNVVPPGGAANLPVGRYAWWVDDEGTKGNLNQLGGNKSDPTSTTSLLPSQTNFPLNWSMLFATESGAASVDSDLARLASRSQRFFSTEMLKDSSWGGQVGADVYRNYKGQITAWSSNVDLAPWGTPRINLSDPAVTSAQILTALTSAPWANFFPAGSGLAAKYGGGTFGTMILSQIGANLQAFRGTPDAPVPNNTTAFNGNLAALRHRFSLPNNPLGHRYNNGTQISRHPYLSEVMASVDSMAAGNTITVTFYLRVELVNPFADPFPANAFTLEILPRKCRFHVTTGSATAVPSVTGPTEFPAVTGTIWEDARGASAGLTGTLGCWAGPMIEDNNPWPVGSVVIRQVPGLGAQTHTMVDVPLAWTLIFAGVNPVRVDQAYMMVDRVVLKSAAGTILDWISLDDFAQASNFGSSYTAFAADRGQMAFNRPTATYPLNRRGTSYTRVGPSQNTGAFSPVDAQGMGKNDPQVRIPVQAWLNNGLGQFADNSFPAGWRAWFRTFTPTPGGPNTGIFDCTTGSGQVTGLTHLSPDPVPSGITVTTHPHFVAGYAPTNGLQSVAQLGAVHTGLPWRTLRFLPTPSAELALGPPDWVLMDLFTVTNPVTARSMINVNSVGLDQAGQIQVSGNPAHRAWAVMAAMSSLTNSRTAFFDDNSIRSQLATWGVPESFATDNNARISATGANAFANVGPGLRDALADPASAVVRYTGSSPAQSSGWAVFRAGANDLWPDQGMAFRGELAELSALTQAGTTLSEDQQEGRLRFFMDLLTTRSDTFTVWSAGQGLVVFTNTLGQVRTNIMGEVRKQTVFQRVATTDSTGQVTGWKVQVLYTRDHVVE